MAILSESLRKSEASNVFLTGTPALDKDLGNLFDCKSGIPYNSFLELSGFPGSGRTAIWLDLVYDALLKGFEILFVSCNFLKFPIERLETYERFNPDRHPSRIHTMYITSIEQLLLLELETNAQVIIFDGYDSLVSRDWPTATRHRAGLGIVNKLSNFSAEMQKCVIATSKCIRFFLTEKTATIAPAMEFNLDKGPQNLVRLQIFKVNDNPSHRFLSTGLGFQISDGRIEELEEDTRIPPAPLSSVSSAKRKHSSSPFNVTRSDTIQQLSPLSKRAKLSSTIRNASTQLASTLVPPQTENHSVSQPIEPRANQPFTSHTQFQSQPKPYSMSQLCSPAVQLTQNSQSSINNELHLPNPDSSQISSSSQSNRVPSHRAVYMSTKDIPRFSLGFSQKLNTQEQEQEPEDPL